MTIRSAAAVAFMAAFTFLLHASAANAQATRTWVSGVGDDANPCSRTAPCKTFAGAISKTAAGGEINAIDSGGFGALTITKAISIVADGALGGVLVSGTNGITINAGATDRVLLQGLDIEGLGTGLNGVKVFNAGTVIIRNSQIRNFRGAEPAGNGVLVESTSGTRVLITESLINANNIGVMVAPSVALSTVTLDRTVVANNASFAVRGGNGAHYELNGSVLTGSPVAVKGNGTAEFISYGNNVIVPVPAAGRLVPQPLN